jgi:hypothetical protein
MNKIFCNLKGLYPLTSQESPWVGLLIMVLMGFFSSVWIGLLH